MKKSIAVLACLWVLSLSLVAFAIDEENYDALYPQVLEWADTTGVESTFLGEDDAEIAYIAFDHPDPKGALLILSGRTETYLKYLEVAYDLRDLGLSIYMMDYRGQGLSDRLIEDEEKGYVRDFDDYVDDMKTFVDTIVKADGHDKIFALAHSMGGAAATLYAQRYPNDFAGLILSSPMHRIDTGNIPEKVAYSIATSLTAIGKGEEYVMGTGPWQVETFESNVVTHSYARFTSAKALLNEDPSLRLGGPTNKWIKESIEGCAKSRRRALTMKLPILLFQASEDVVVKTQAQDWVCTLARNCEKIVFEGAYHEILMETDDLRDVAIDAVADFILDRIDTPTLVNNWRPIFWFNK